jgi:RimJ/RimL family protein N-acetyltransferase
MAWHDPRVPTLETERLLLRPLTNDDLEAFTEIMSDREVVRFLGHDPMTREGAWRSIAYFLGHEVLRGYTNNAVVEKATGRLLGRCGLYYPEGWPGLEVGWTLGRAAWGHGYATEAAAAWRDYAFDVLGAEDLCSVIHRDNVRSIRVAERIGHAYRRDIEVLGHPCVLYGQSRP